MKRKILSLLTLGTLMVSLIGCGKASTDNTSQQPSNVQTAESSDPADNTEPADTEVVEDTPVSFGDIAVGEYVTFGSYEQDNDKSNGSEPIGWIVLDHQDGKTLLYSRYGLDYKPFNDVKKPEDTTWAECSLRTWMNTEMYDAMFTDEEKESVVLSHITTPDPTPDVYWAEDPTFEGKYELATGGEDTDDYVFLLSINEFRHYYDAKFANEYPSEVASTVADRTYFEPANGQAWICIPSDYVLAQSRSTVNDYCVYFLRSPMASLQSSFAIVGTSIDFASANHVSDHVVRPAIWVND